MTESLSYDEGPEKIGDYQKILDFWTFGRKNVHAERDVKKWVAEKRAEAKKFAQQAWNYNVHDRELAAAVLCQARAAYDQAADGEEVKPDLAHIIRHTDVRPAPAVQHRAAAKPAAPPPDPVAEAFERVWGSWHPSERFRESRASAASAWRSAAARADLAELEAACTYYTSQVECAGEVPHGLGYILTACPKDSELPWWQHWAQRASFALSPREQAEFEALWAVLPDYPNKAGEQRQAAAEWRRRVEPADRLHCLMAARAYAAERAREVGEDPAAAKYTAHFSGFLDRWRAVDPKLVAPEVCDVCGPLVAALGGLGGYNFNQQHQSGVTYLVVNRAMGPAEAVAYRVRQAAELAKKAIDVPAVVAQVLETTYKSACRRAGVVLP